MSRYRRNKSLETALPTFDIARQWRHPAILFVLTIVLVISTSLVIQGFQGGVSQIVSMLVLDVSRSALDNPDWRVEAICDRYQQYLRPGDYQADTWFADEARVVFDGVVKNLPVPYACQPTSKELVDHQIGQRDGTFLHKAVLRLSDALQEIPATYLDAPVLVTVVLHELDSVTPSEDLEALAQGIAELADAVRWIRVLGPEGETATNLRQVLGPLPNARFCTLNDAERDVDECLGAAFQEARSIDE